MPNKNTEECKLFILQYIDTKSSPVVAIDLRDTIEGSFGFNANSYRAANEWLLKNDYISEAPGVESGAGNRLIIITETGKRFLESQAGLIGAERVRDIIALNENKPDDIKIAFAQEMLAALGLRADRIIPAGALSRGAPPRGGWAEGR